MNLALDTTAAAAAAVQRKLPPAPLRWIDLRSAGTDPGAGRSARPDAAGAADAESAVSLLESPPWQLGRWRYHPDCELHLLLDPHDGARVGGASHSFASGSAVLIGPRLPHNLACAPADGDRPAARSLMLRFGGELPTKGAALFPELRSVRALLECARLGVEFQGFGERLAERLRGIRSRQGLARLSLFMALLDELAQWPHYRLLSTPRFAEGDAEEEERGTQARRSQRLYRALDHIRDNFADELTLSGVSAVAGMPVSAFSRSFRHATGQTFTDHVIGLRVAEACRLLLQTRRQVSSICYEVGFNNISNFNRHFRRLRGVPPGEYRARGGRIEATGAGGGRQA